jgi:hypothetical protein
MMTSLGNFDVESKRFLRRCKHKQENCDKEYLGMKEPELPCPMKGTNQQKVGLRLWVCVSMHVGAIVMRSTVDCKLRCQSGC